jgi:fructose-1-phosphate kinase PfkB-like protein
MVLGANPAWQKNATCAKLANGNVVRIRPAQTGAAGKGFNCASALRRLGKAPLLLSGIGTDAREWEDACRAEGIELLGFPLAGRIRQALTLRDLETNEVTELVEEGPPAADGAQRIVEDALGRELSSPLCCCGTLAPGLDAEGIFSVVATRTGIVVIDSLPLVRAALSARQTPARMVLKLNESEWTHLVGHDLKSSWNVVRTSLPKARLVATRGAGGSMASQPGAKSISILAPMLPLGTTVHPIGAGDAYTAGLVDGLSDGMELAEACRRAAALARASCLDPLPARFSPEDFEESLELVYHA